MEKFIRKNTWIGLGIAVCLLIMGLAVGAALLCRGNLSEQSQKTYLTVVCGISSFCGCWIAARGKELHLVRATVTAALLDILLWMLTFTADGVVVMDSYAIRTTLAVLLGGILASLLVPRKQAKHKAQKGKRSVTKRRRHTVT